MAKKFNIISCSRIWQFIQTKMAQIEKKMTFCDITCKRQHVRTFQLLRNVFSLNQC